jgi:hypothetical protein
MSGADVPAVSLTANERVPGRAFADPVATLGDLAVLAAIRAAQRDRIVGERGCGSWIDQDGATHWLVAPRPELVREPSPCLAVGFFGQARSNVDHTIIVSLEHAMLSHAEAIPGLLAYHNVQLANAQWGNLVLFEAGTDTAPMRGEPTHADAIGRAPAHYHSLRLHRGTLERSSSDEEEILLSTTLYLDFEESPPWRAVRSA